MEVLLYVMHSSRYKEYYIRIDKNPALVKFTFLIEENGIGKK